MLVYNIISVICLVYMAALIGIFFYKLKTSYKGSVEFLRSFKKGSFALIYFVAIPLYTMGYVYSNPEMTFINALFNGIAKTSTLVGLRYDVSSVEDLIAANPTFATAVYTCFILVGINAFLVIASLTHQRVKVWWKTNRWYKKDYDVRVLIVGNNKNNLKIYESVLDDKDQLCLDNDKTDVSCMAALVDKLSEDDLKKLYISGINVLGPSRKDEDVESALKKTMADSLKQEKHRTIIVINTHDDEKNVKLCSLALEFINETVEKLGVNKNANNVSDEDKKKIVSLFEKLPIYVFGNPEHEGIYTNMVENSHGCIHYVNKYRRIALDFIDRYPISKFLGDAIDGQTALVKENANINVALIGFGKTNQQIFLASVANNQFMTVDKDGKPVLKKVNYRIFDKMYPDNIKNLNHTYYRFKNEMEMADRTQYLPIPPKPANDKYFSFEINCPSFYFILRDFLKTKDSLNYVVIGFGTDLENIDMAQKLLEKAQEWKISNYKIFVKVRSGKSQADIFKNNNCFIIGNENDVAYDIGEITNGKLEAMAKERDLVYRKEKAVKENGGKPLNDAQNKDVEMKAKYDWYIDLSQIERDSNVYGVLSIRSKLNMLGMDYCARENCNGKTVIDDTAYKAAYDTQKDIDGCARYQELVKMNEQAKKNNENITPDLEAELKSLEKYAFGYPEKDTAKRGNLAVQEHYRWNAYMISRGLIPATIDDIKNEYLEKHGEVVLNNQGLPKFSDGKNYKLRRHGNITTMEGLERFRQIVCERDARVGREGTTLVSADVIKYDYEILDDACRILNKIGYDVYELPKGAENA